MSLPWTGARRVLSACRWREKAQGVAVFDGVAVCPGAICRPVGVVFDLHGVTVAQGVAVRPAQRRALA